MSDDTQPQGEPAIRTIAMPADTNANGDIFGGWLMAQMDLAGGSAAVRRARGRRQAWTSNVIDVRPRLIRRAHTVTSSPTFTGEWKIMPSTETVAQRPWLRRAAAFPAARSI